MAIWRVDPLLAYLGHLRYQNELLDNLVSRCTPTPPRDVDQKLRILAEALRSPEFLAAQLEQAEEATRLALAEAVHGDGSLDVARFKARYDMESPLPEFHSYPRPSFDPVAALLFHNNAVAPDLVYRLRGLLPPPEPFAIPAEDRLPETVPNRLGEPTPLRQLLTEEAALHDLLAVLSLAGDGKVAASTATSQPTGPTVRILQERFLVPDVVPVAADARAEDTVRPFALAMVVQAAGLARPKDGRLELTTAGRDALDSPSAELLRRCWNGWVAWNGFDELSRIRAIKGQNAKGVRLTKPSERRAAINRALAACPQGSWMSIKNFFRLVRANGYDFAIDAREKEPLQVDYSFHYTARMQSRVDRWEWLNGTYIRAVLLEYAASLGMLDVGTVPPEQGANGFGERMFSRYDGLAYLRINALGGYALGLAESYHGPALLQEQPAITVLPSLDVVVTQRADLTPNEQATLERFAAKVSDDVFKLSRERLLDAAEAGLAVRDAEEFLRRRSRHELPQTVRVLFDDAARGAEMVRLGAPARLLHCNDAMVARLIRHDATLGKLCRLVDDGDLVVAQANLPAFRRGLKRLGYVLPGR